MNKSQVPTSTEITKEYQEVLTKFSQVLQRLAWASVKAKNIDGGERRYWGSVVFTRLVIVGTSILSLCPDSELCSTINWDFASVASLVRNLHECSLMFFYLSIEPISDDEWRARLNVMQLHDNLERHKMLSDLSTSSNDSAIYASHESDLRKKLLANSYFVSLGNDLQKKLLKGTSSKILTNKEISHRMGDGEAFIWGLHRLFSAHTHTAPLSFYRIGEQGRTGIENDVDKGYIGIALDFANQILSRALEDFVASFSGFVDFDFERTPNTFRFLLKKSPAVYSLSSHRVPGRNEPCYCGSGKKYKRCHGV